MTGPYNFAEKYLVGGAKGIVGGRLKSNRNRRGRSQILKWTITDRRFGIDTRFDLPFGTEDGQNGIEIKIGYR